MRKLRVGQFSSKLGRVEPRVRSKHLWFSAPFLAAQDAIRAFLIIPQRFAKDTYEILPEGGWGIRSRRPFTLREKIVKKVIQAGLTYNNSLQLRVSKEIVVPRLSTEGLLANFLHVLEVLKRAREGSVVRIDWVLRGDEVGFRYGKVNDDVWQSLFKRLGQETSGGAHRAITELDFTFWGTGKDYLMGARLAAHRHSYHRVFTRYIQIVNPRVAAEARQVSEQSMRGIHCIGIHRRVGNVKVANCHIDGRVPSIEQFSAAVLKHAEMLGNDDWRVYVATDDSSSIEEFRRVFTYRLIWRDKVKRTSAHAREVHQNDWSDLSSRNAEDALIDTIVISQCAILFHSSSSISTVAGIMNPTLPMVRVWG
jgi:hypothetical protein